MDKTAIRDASTIIVLRDPQAAPAVLMGQRGARAAFMPGKFVFPGGAVDPNDAIVPATPISTRDDTRLTLESSLPPTALAAAAIRELWEETGQILGHSQPWNDPPQGWRGFANAGFVPMQQRCSFSFAPSPLKAALVDLMRVSFWLMQQTCKPILVIFRWLRMSCRICSGCHWQRRGNLIYPSSRKLFWPNWAPTSSAAARLKVYRFFAMMTKRIWLVALQATLCFKSATPASRC